jgi:LPXTG-motif cell wall-anchored protein
VQSDLPFLLGISLAMALLGALLYGRNKKNRDTE